MATLATPSDAMARSERPIPSPVLGMLIFIGTETMFFAALISAHVVMRAGETLWPPILQPRLPAEATAVNTAILLASGMAVFIAARAHARPFRARTALRSLSAGIALGAAFIVFQGFEWVRLIGFGLTARSSLYGALFYVIVGAHAVHAIAGLCALGYARWAAGARKISAAGFAAIRMFWYFVVGVWPVLYVLVYLL